MASQFTVQRTGSFHIMNFPKVQNRWDLVCTIEDGADTAEILYKDTVVATIPRDGLITTTFTRWLKATTVAEIAQLLYSIQEANEDFAPGRDYNKVVEFAQANRRLAHDGFTL